MKDVNDIEGHIDNIKNNKDIKNTDNVVVDVDISVETKYYVDRVKKEMKKTLESGVIEKPEDQYAFVIHTITF